MHPRRVIRFLSRGLRAPRERQLLWLRALAVVALVRLGLWSLPLARLQVLVARVGRGRYSAPLPAAASEAPQVLEVGTHGEPPAVREAAWAVRSAARVVPQASCLTQALSLQVLLARRGIGSRLCLGVRRGGPTNFQAHAWVERGSRILIGGEEAARWTPLTSWNFAARRARV